MSLNHCMIVSLPMHVLSSMTKPHLSKPIQPSKIGRVMDVEASIIAINDALLRGEHNVPLVVSKQQPLWLQILPQVQTWVLTER